jgi:hypothetical protein
MTSETRNVANLWLRLMIPVLALHLVAACATDHPVKRTGASSDGPTVYGQVSVSADHVSRR